MERSNLISVFESFRLRSDSAVVQTHGYRRLTRTYLELYTSALFWSYVLCGRGVGRGDRVLIWGVNSAEWVACFWGLLLRGAIAVPMDPGASLDFVTRTVRQSGAKLILRDRSLPELDVDPAVPSLVLNDLRAVSAGPKQREAAEVDPSDRSTRADVAEILFTSGTTSEPRGVVLTHGNFLANLEPIESGVQSYLKYERWMHPLRFVSLVPLSHVFGQFMTLFVPPLLGATVVFENSANPVEILRTVKRERATALIAVPRMLDGLRAAVEREIDARSWRKWFAANYEAAQRQPFLRRAWRFRRIHWLFGWRFWAFICGGAALSRETETFFKQLGFAVVQGYGMTETASLISLNHPFRAAEGSVGKVLPGREFKLADDGEILVRGENVSAGYWEKGALQRAVGENGGWLRTGDLGELDAGGNLRFRGRKKNVIVTPAGLNIYPEDLEAELTKQQGVRDAVVVGVERGGNAEACAVMLVGKEVQQVKEGEEKRARDLAETAVVAANRSLAEYQRIRRWVVWPEPDFPRTATGKPKLAVIAARAEKQLAEENHAGFERRDIHDPDAMTQLLGARTRGASLSSLSSLDRVELLAALEQRYNVEIDEAEFARANSPEDLRRLVERPGAAPSAQTGERADPSSARYHYPRWAQWEAVRWARLFVYYLLVWPATQILAHPRVIGRHHLQGVRGPVIVICNHITRRADIGLVLAALPARFRHRLAAAMGGETLLGMRIPPRHWWFAKRCAYQLGYWLVTALFNVFPLPQLSGFRQSFRFAGESVDRGYSMLIFPEGEVNNSEDGRMAPFRSGVGLLAENLSLAIVPMRLDGVWQMKRERRRLARLGEITVHIGALESFEPGTPAEEIARHLQKVVEAL